MSAPLTADPLEPGGLDAAPASLVAWVETELGATVVAAARQGRWRPAWYLDFVRDGRLLALYARGERGALDHGVYDLAHEQTVLEVLGAHGIPVPAVYGFCPDPPCIVMSRIAGTANLSLATPDDDPVAVLAQYMRVLAAIHRIGAAPFEARGLTRGADNPALADLDRWEAAYRERKNRPEPLIEFVLRWLRDHAPDRRARTTLAVGDSGQFLYRGASLCAVIDLELAFLGDPLHDLACLRLRDLAEPLGDLAAAFAVYEAETGEPVDRAVLDFHTIRFALCTPMSVCHLFADPPAELDLVRYLNWYVQFGRVAVETMADLLGIGLDPPDSPPAQPSRFAATPRLLEAALADLHPTDPQESYRLDVAQRTGDFMRALLEQGADLDAADRADAASLLGHVPATWHDCDRELERLVLSDAPPDPEQLVRFFHRRSTRWQGLLTIGMKGRRHSLQPLG